MFVKRTVQLKQIKSCDITAELKKAVEESGVKEGLCSVTVLSESTGIVSISGKRQEILEDILDDLERVLPPRINYRDNSCPVLAAGKTKAALVESSKDFIIHEGEVLTSGNVYLLPFADAAEGSYAIICCG